MKQDKSILLPQIAYEAYAEYTGNKNYLGKSMPKYNELPDNIKGPGLWHHRQLLKQS